MYELLNGQPELTEALMKAYELKGDLPDGIVGQLAPVIEVDSLHVGRSPEYGRLRRWALARGGDNVPAVAAQLSWSGVIPRSATVRGICVVELVQVSNPSAATLAFQLAQAQIPGAVGGNATVRDDRMNQISPGGSFFTGLFGVVSGQSAGAVIPAGAGQNFTFNLPAGGSIVIPLDDVLTGKPNDTSNPVGVFVQATTVNTAINVGWRWRERQALASELT